MVKWTGGQVDKRTGEPTIKFVPVRAICGQTDHKFADKPTIPKIKSMNPSESVFKKPSGIDRQAADNPEREAVSAEQWHADAQCALGVMYSDGRGVTRDEEEAVKWYRKSAKQGNTGALLRKYTMTTADKIRSAVSNIFLRRKKLRYEPVLQWKDRFGNRFTISREGGEFIKIVHTGRQSKFIFLADVYSCETLCQNKTVKEYCCATGSVASLQRDIYGRAILYSRNGAGHERWIFADSEADAENMAHSGCEIPNTSNPCIDAPPCESTMTARCYGTGY